MNVIQYTAKYLPISQTFIRDLIQYLSLSGIENTILTHKVEPSTENSNDIVIDISYSHYPSLYRRALNYFHTYFGRAANINYSLASRLITTKKVDVIHCHFGTAAYYYYHLQKKQNLNYPLLISLHGFDVFSVQKLEHDYISAISSLVAAGSLISAPSNFLKEKIISTFNIDESKIRVIPNGFNSQLFSIQDYKKPNSKQFNIGHCGRFVDWKGQEFLLRALSQLVIKGYDNIYLTLIGTGELFDEMKALSQKLGLEKYVNFAGGMSHESVAKLLGEQNLYVHPSFTMENGQAETFGIAILEAIALGMPVVITESGGMKEIFPDQNNQFVKVVKEQSVDALVESIEYFINNMNEFSSEDYKAFQTEVLQKNNLENTTRLVAKCYKELIERSHL